VAIGFLLFVGLFFLILMFAVGGSGNPPLPSPLGQIVTYLISLGTFWFVFILVGTVLIAVGHFQRRPSPAN
jgi:hypothetical protein